MRAKFTDLFIRNAKPGEYWDAAYPAFGLYVGKRSRTWIVKSGNSRKKIGDYPATTLSEARRMASEPRSTEDSIESLFVEFERIYLPSVSKRVASEWTRLLKRFLHLNNPSPRDIHTILEQLKPSEANHSVVALNRLYSWSRETGRTVNPLKLKKIHKEQSRTRVLSDAEIKAVWKASLSMHDYGALVRLLLLTGQRKTEVQTFDIDYSGAFSLTWKTTKNGQPHAIPYIEEWMPHFSALFDNHGKLANWDWYKRKLEKASLVTDFTLHDLRRTHASLQARLNTPPHVIERILNHAAPGVAGIYNRYSYEKEMREALEKVSVHLHSLCS